MADPEPFLFMPYL